MMMNRIDSDMVANEAIIKLRMEAIRLRDMAERLNDPGKCGEDSLDGISTDKETMRLRNELLQKAEKIESKIADYYLRSPGNRDVCRVEQR